MVEVRIMSVMVVENVFFDKWQNGENKSRTLF